MEGDCFIATNTQNEEYITKCQIDFKNKIDGIQKQYDITPIINIFYEAFMNICQHSGSEYSGFILVKICEERISFYISDTGKGIAKNIKDYYTELKFENDADAFDYAVQDGITTHTTTQNQGKGLANINSQLSAVGGEWLIYTNTAIIERKYEKCEKYDSDTKQFKVTKSQTQYQTGTFFRIIIEKSHLQPADKNEYDENIDF